MPEPVSLLAHLRGEGYHPRSSKHGDAMVRAIVEDLMAYCPKIAEHVAAGRLVYNVGHKLRIGMDSWNTDLAIGTAPPSGVLGAVPTLAGMPRAVPVHVRIAVEAKAVMTKHAGARRNRKRDLEAHHDHVHRYRTETVAAGLTIVNASSSFYSPVPPEGMRYHRQPRDAEGVVDVMRGVTRSVSIGRAGMVPWAYCLSRWTMSSGLRRGTSSSRPLRSRAIRSTGTHSSPTSAPHTTFVIRRSPVACSPREICA